jgi:EAL domain-containing protein (putative c-di-GMP-specific phosphodiesterase class I)
MSPDLIPALDGIPPERLLLELPEDTVISDYERTKVVIDRLTGLGYRLAMDDLAKGRIDLWYLVRLRPSIVKVDISMIRDIDLDPSKQSLVNGLRLLGEVLRADVVAEGIERKGELDQLQSLGVHYGQGFLLGRPGPLDNPPAWLHPKWLEPPLPLPPKQARPSASIQFPAEHPLRIVRD